MHGLRAVAFRAIEAFRSESARLLASCTLFTWRKTSVLIKAAAAREVALQSCQGCSSSKPVEYTHEAMLCQDISGAAQLSKASPGPGHDLRSMVYEPEFRHSGEGPMTKKYAASVLRALNRDQAQDWSRRLS